MTRIGDTTSGGVAAMNAEDIFTNFGVDGSGVTVGVISDSYDCASGSSASADVASGDIPAGVVVLQDLSSFCSDEGRAMLQIVHDVAPGANLAFETGFIGGKAGFASAIGNLQATAGADVIVDDLIYLSEPMFQDGVIAQAIDNVVASGTAYFSSAGNDARKSYESAYSPNSSCGLPPLSRQQFSVARLGNLRHDYRSGCKCIWRDETFRC